MALEPPPTLPGDDPIQQLQTYFDTDSRLDSTMLFRFQGVRKQHALAPRLSCVGFGFDLRWSRTRTWEFIWWKSTMIPASWHGWGLWKCGGKCFSIIPSQSVCCVEVMFIFNIVWSSLLGNRLLCWQPVWTTPRETPHKCTSHRKHRWLLPELVQVWLQCGRQEWMSGVAKKRGG